MRLSKYDYIFFFGIALWIAESAFFGWHETATSVPEKILNQASLFIGAYGFIGGIVKALAPVVNLNTKSINI